MNIKIIHIIHIICLFLFFKIDVLAQSFIVRAGANLGASAVSSSNFNDYISKYNIMYGSSWKGDTNMLSSFDYGLHLAVRLKYGMVLLSEFHLGSFQNQLNTPSLTQNYMDIRVESGFYLFRLLDTSINEKIKRNFFFSIGFAFQISSFLEDRNIIKNGDTMGLGLGLGYDFYISDKISITPTLYPTYYFNDFKKENKPISITPQFSSFQYQFRLRLGYTIKPEKPLCPVKGCQVRQEHKHQVFGNTIVRGNPYHKKQNPRYGDKYKPLKSKKKNVK